MSPGPREGPDNPGQGSQPLPASPGGANARMSRVPRAPPTVLMPFTGPEHLLSRGVGGNSSSSGLAAAGLSQEPGKGLREKLEPPLHWAGKTRGALGWERSLERRTRKNQDTERGTEKDTQTPRTSRERKDKRARRPRDRHAERTGESERREEGLPPPPGHDRERPWQLLSWGSAAACWTLPAGLWEGGGDRTHLEAVRVPQGGGCGDEARHEPRLKSGRILQRPELAGGREAPQTGFSGLIFLRGPKGQRPQESWGPQEDWVGKVVRGKPGSLAATPLQTENRGPRRENVWPKVTRFPGFLELLPLPVTHSRIHSVIPQALAGSNAKYCARY